MIHLDEQSLETYVDRIEEILEGFSELSVTLDDYARDIRADRGGPYAEGLADGIELATSQIDKTVKGFEQ